MEFKIVKQGQPAALEFNYEELKAEIEEKAKVYEAMVYTDANIADAKQDRATLNKLKTALNDERKRREKEYMAPFEDFKKKVNEIIAIIDKPVGIIDKQVKEYENAEKEQKRRDIEGIFRVCNMPEWLTLEKVWNEKWLNKTYAVSTIKAELGQIYERIQGELAMLENMGDFSYEATEVYKTTLDVAKAVSEGKRLADIQKRKQEQEEARKTAEAARIAEEKAKAEAAAFATPTPAPVEAPAPEPAPAEEEKGQWIAFEVCLTREQAISLRDFLKENGIPFRKA